MHSKHLGFCIYCAAPIELNLAEPVCEAHRMSWRLIDSHERAYFCHRCGRRKKDGYCRHDPCCEKCDKKLTFGGL